VKFAAIADIHGNYAALEAVLADIAALGIGEVVNLGDHLSGPLEPQRTADLLIARGFPSIRGDQDRILVELGPAGTSRRLDHKRLQQRHLDWLADLPPTLIYRDDVFLCHGTPEDDAAFWLDRVTADGKIEASPIREIEAEANGVGVSLILCGHTHIPRAVRLGDGRLVVNPGSVGSPGYRDTHPHPHVIEAGTPDARYAILELSDGNWRVTFRHVPYDHEAMAALARQNDQPELASALATGWIT